MSSNYLVIELLTDTDGYLFPAKAGSRRVIRHSTPCKIVERVRAKKSISWGGATVSAKDYKAIHDGPWNGAYDALLNLQEN